MSSGNRAAREGRDPCRFFDTAFYVAAHSGQGAARETALAFYAERGCDGWHSTHPVLPPPASPSAYFEELPWQTSIPAPSATEAPFRTLIVDVGEAAGRETAALRQLLTTLVTLPGLDVYCVTDASMESIPGVAILDLSRPDLASLDRTIVLDRILRAIKFRDPKGLVCEMACTALPLAGRTLSWRYDAAGRVIATDNGLGGVLRYQWNGNSISAVTDAAGATARFVPDDFGRVAAVVEPAGGIRRYFYDETGRVLAVKSPLGDGVAQFQ